MNWVEFYNESLLSIPYDKGLIIASITDIISYSFFAVLEMLFVNFLCGNGGKTNKKFWVLTINLFILNSINGVVIYNYSHQYIISMFITYFLNITVPLIYLFSSFKQIEAIYKIIPPFMYQVIYIFSYIVSVLFYTFLFPADFTQAVFCTGVEKTIMICITLIIHIILILLIVMLYKRMMNSKGEFVVLCFSTPLPLFLAIYVLLYPLVSNYEDVVRYFGGFFEFQSGFFRFGIIIAVLSALGTYFLLFQMWRKSKIEKEKELYENMLRLEKKHYEDIIASSEQIKKTRHDIKNMLYSVKAELDDDNLIKSKEKLNEILHRVNSVGSVIESKNRIVDCIVNSKLSDMGNRSINVTGDISGMDEIKDVDISIILGNILDNAIDATNDIDNAVIKLVFYVKGNYQNILCENTISQSVLGRNPKLKTSKTEKSFHGFGIKSVKDVVSSYEGTVSIFEKNEKFCVHIMIPIT